MADTSDDAIWKSLGAQAQPAPATAPANDDAIWQSLGTGKAAETPKQADKPAPPDLPVVSEYGDVGPGAWFNQPGGAPPSGPAAVTAPPLPGSITLPSKQDIQNALAPAPNTTYSDTPWIPLARDNTTGAIRLALPGPIRSALQDLVAGPSADVTIDPATNALGVTPGAAFIGSLAVPELRFGGGRFVPPGTLDTAISGKPIPPDVAPNLLSSDARARIASGDYRGEQYGPPPAGAAPPPAPAAPTDIPVTPPAPPPAPTVAQTPAFGGAVGADVTANVPPMTQAERIAGLEKSVKQSAEDRAGPRLQDDTAYVPDIPPRMLAAQDFSTSANALDTKRAMAEDPAFRDTVEANLRDRNNGMKDLLDNDAQDSNALDRAYDYRDQANPNAMGVFTGQTATDASGLLTTIDTLLNGPEGKTGAIRTTLQNVRDSLFDNDGNLETMPDKLYGARQNLTSLLKRGVKGTGELADDVRASKSILEGLIPQFDQIISSGAPKFQNYLQEWTNRSQPINQMEWLQQYQTGAKKLTGADGYLQFNKVQKMLDDALQGNKAAGVNKAKSLTDQQLGNIEAVRNELGAQQLQDRLAAVRGSDTFQQFNARLMGEGPIAEQIRQAREMGLGVATGGLYNWLVRPGLDTARGARIARKVEARKQQLLNPLEPPPSTPPAGPFVQPPP